MSSKQHEVRHLNEQDWYDYRVCLRAVARKDKSWKFLAGAIFAVKIASIHKDLPPHTFFALKLCEGGPIEDRYRMCLYARPLVAQRVLRGLEEPKKKPPKQPMDPYIPKGSYQSWTI